jgi:hypothetical protein
MSIKAGFSLPARGGCDLSQALVARFSQSFQPEISQQFPNHDLKRQQFATTVNFRIKNT